VQHFVWPGITFSWQAQYFRQMEWNNCKLYWYEAVSSAPNFPALKEVSQNCFVFDGSFVDWRCQVQTLRTSRRIASFLTLSTSKIEEVSQNSFAFKLADNTTTLHCATLHYATLRYTTLPYATLDTLRYTTLHYATLGYTTLHYYNYNYKTNTNNYKQSTPLHSATLH